MIRLRIIFVKRLPPGVLTGHWVDFSEERIADNTRAVTDSGCLVAVDLVEICKKSEERWKKIFIDWLGGLNVTNAGLEWWAYTSSAKNMLSSPLGNQIFQVLALCEIAGQGGCETLYVIGATHAQISAFRGWARQKADLKIEVANADGWRWFVIPLTVGRLLFQLLRVWIAFTFSGHRISPSGPCDLLLFTYVDSRPKEGADSYYGRLATTLAAASPDTRVAYAAYVYAPYHQRLQDIASLKVATYLPIFKELSFIDLAWALALSLKALRTSSHRVTTSHEQDVSFIPMLRDALLRDIGVGGYFHNLLVYRCIPRLVAKMKPSVLVYPYENKSLEKLLLLALRRYCPTLSIIGFQHTSITPRHTTLLFAPDEASRTPLPDRIVTVGDITRRYLESNGNYPEGIFLTGCALRQSWREPAPWKPVGDRPPRVLLAMSSSRSELVQAVAYFMRLHEAGVRFELGIRPHADFPLRLLPSSLAKWGRETACDFSGSNLADNIDWCDVTAYISSTVALEALIAGKPVINIRIQDMLDPDPILGEPALCWRVANSGEFSGVLASICAITPEEHLRLAAEAAVYVRSYLRPASSECAKLFLSAARAASSPPGIENISLPLDARSSREF